MTAQTARDFFFHFAQCFSVDDVSGRQESNCLVEVRM